MASLPSETAETEKEADVAKVTEVAEADSGIESSNDSTRSGDNTCKLIPLKTEKPLTGIKGPTFWDLSWRKKLCSCAKCKALYEQSGCSFLANEEDTCHFYEAQGKETRIQASSMERGMSAMSESMPRTQQIEILHGYNAMQAALKEYLRPLAEAGQVVTEEHIKTFFEEFKRRRPAQTQLDLGFNCR